MRTLNTHMTQLKIAIIDIIGIPYDGTTVFKQGLGGSESAVTLMGQELRSLGFEVTVFNNCNIDHAHPGIYSGVVYRPLNELANDHEFDIVISSRTIIPFVAPQDYERIHDRRAWPFRDMNLYDRILSKAKMRILWMHDTFCLGDALIEELALSDRITDIFTLSDWHLTYIANCDHGRRRNFEVLKRKIFITRNGANSYKKEVDIRAKDRNLFVYNASVSKGMTPLVEQVWPRVKQAIPEAQLKIIGGYYRFSSNDEPDEQEKKWRSLADDPNNPQKGIEFTGIIPQKEIAEILAKANFMIYPAAFPETFGISTLESLLYNTPSITCRFGALEEIALEGACYLIDYAIEPNNLFQHINTEHQVNLFVDTVIKAYHNTYLHQQKQYYCNIIKDIAGWDSVAKQWRQWFYKRTGEYLPVDQYREVSKINHRVHKIWQRRYHNTVEIESYKSGNEQEIVVITPFYNCAQYIERCIESVAAQDYDNYKQILIDDCSTDNSFDVAVRAVMKLPDHRRSRFAFLRNTENNGAVKNQIDHIRKIANENAIVMLLDGDDSLVNDNSIFSYYNTIYDGNTEFTYGSCWSMVDNIPLISQPYPESIKKDKAYRTHHFNWIMPYTHLRTFKKYLVTGLDDHLFQDSAGKWYKAGGDGSLFYAVMEAAEPAKVKCLQDIVYNYNDINPLNDYKVNGTEQNITARDIINKTVTKKYSVVVPTMWRAADQFVGFLDQLCKHPSIDEIIIINNDNTKTPQGLTHPKIKMFDFGRNIFVNPAWNFGVRTSRNERVCILNDDVVFDLNVLARLEDMLTEDNGIFGLCPGEPDFNQPPVTDKSIEIIPWTGQHTYGYGCLMFLNKKIWTDIPDGLEIYYGDNFIFDLQLRKGKTNYIIANMDFHTAFATTTSDRSITQGYLEKETPIYDQLKVNMTNANILEDEYRWVCETPSDIHQHLPFLRSLAAECETVAEFGVRTGLSTRALLAANCRLWSYDLQLDTRVSELFDIARSYGKQCQYEVADTLTMDLHEVDMLFIDTDHTYQQLSQELARHHTKAKKYIAFHDTYTYGLRSDAHPTKGLLCAILEFLTDHPEWRLKYHTGDNNGFTVIERVHQQPVVQTVAEIAPAAPKKRILIGIPTARNIEVDTFKAIYDLEVPDGYEFDFQYFYGYNIDQVRNLIAHWAIHYDYLFSVDSDIAFATDTVKKLLAHDKDVVSGLYIQRKPGQHILELYEHNGYGGVSNIPYEKIKDQGLVEIAGCGFGCVLVKSEVFREVGYPQFEYHSALDHAHTISEDNDFCRKARDKGFRIWADTSIQCRHIGAYTFTVDNNIQALQPPVKPDPKTIQEQMRDYSKVRAIGQQHTDYLNKIKSDYNFNPSVVYDIGANVLHWYNEAKTVWPNAQYIALDATDSLKFLYDEAGITNHICVLSDRDGKEVDFYQSETNPGGNSYYKENKQFSPNADLLYNDNTKRKMLTMTLDTLVKVNGYPAPDMLKIDVQGAELDVLRGAQETLKTVKHIILELQIVEYNQGAPLKDYVIGYMNQIGFDCMGIFCDNGPDGDYHFVRRS